MIMKMFITALFLGVLAVAQVLAVETAPRISDREIIEKLSRLEAGQAALQQQINDLKDSTNRRFDTLQWMLGLFITVALFLLGIFGRMLWNQQKELSRLNASVETQKDELAFLKNLIEKLLPPKGVL